MITAIKKRRSHRTYKDKNVEEKQVKEILQAAMFSPSANHIRPWEFIVVRDAETRLKLSEATPWASFAADAPVVIAVCAPEDISKDWVEDCAIVAEHIWLEATEQKLCTCWIQIRNKTANDGRDSEEYAREVLGCPENIRILCLMPIGYPDGSKPEHSDLEYEENKIHRERW